MRAEYDFSGGKRQALIGSKGKTRISIFIDNAVLEAFRARAEAEGTDSHTPAAWQSRSRRQHVTPEPQPRARRRPASTPPLD